MHWICYRGGRATNHWAVIWNTASRKTAKFGTVIMCNMLKGAKLGENSFCRHKNSPRPTKWPVLPRKKLQNESPTSKLVDNDPPIVISRHSRQVAAIFWPVSAKLALVHNFPNNSSLFYLIQLVWAGSYEGGLCNTCNTFTNLQHLERLRDHFDWDCLCWVICWTQSLIVLFNHVPLCSDLFCIASCLIGKSLSYVSIEQ